MLPNSVKLPLFHPQTNPSFFNDDEPLPKLHDSNPDCLNNYFSSNPFKLELKALNHTLKLSSDSNDLPLLLSLKSLDPFTLPNGESLVPYVDLVLVIDHSGSMEGLKLMLVKNTIKALMQFLREDDRVSLVIFDDTAVRLSPLVRLTANNRKELEKAIDSIEPDGGTSIHLGLEFALETLRRRRNKNAISSVLLLSDGLDEDSLFLSQKALETMQIEGHFTVNTFGYGADHDSDLMLGIANLKGGSFYFIDKVELIEDCFVDCLGGLLSIVGVNLKIEIEIPCEYQPFIEKIFIKKLFGEGEVNAQRNQLKIQASHLIAGSHKEFVFVVQLSKLAKKLQDHEKSLMIAKAALSFEKILKNQEKKAVEGSKINEKIQLKTELNLTVLNEDEEVKDYEKDEEVEVNYLRVLAAEKLDIAQKDAEKGQFLQGQQKLDEMIGAIQISKRQNNAELQGIMSNLQQARGLIVQKNYDNVGRHYLNSYKNNFIQQQSHPMYSEQECTKLQKDMLKAVRMKKK